MVACGACLTDSGTAGSELHIVSGGDDCSVTYNMISNSQPTVSTSIRKVDAHSSSIKGMLNALPTLKVGRSTERQRRHQVLRSTYLRDYVDRSKGDSLGSLGE